MGLGVFTGLMLQVKVVGVVLLLEASSSDGY